MIIIQLFEIIMLVLCGVCVASTVTIAGFTKITLERINDIMIYLYELKRDKKGE